MIIQLPRSLHYPITITALLKRSNEDVPRLEPLLLYSYRTTVTEYPAYGEEVKVEKELSAMFDAPVEGRLVRWLVRVGEVVAGDDVAIVEIEEPCSHSVHFGGLCTMCGKDMTEQDYTSFSNRERATIQMSHDSMGLTVSQDEASRLEEEAKRRLLKSRKLSLVVDLDQTIIHATVDPTVGEWKDDPFCINHDSVKDVQAFKLDEDIIGGRGTWYYVKMRPGLKEFLEHISQLYELHIYTMGTRAYALQVKKIVDPDGTIFGERVLSRDESGSMTQKSLQRLFPVDTKMVVIIDDRGDVWKWSENLVKVRPYDFFVGIGDINSSFLPKRQEFPAAPSVDATVVAAQATTTTNTTTAEAEAPLEQKEEARGEDEDVPVSESGSSIASNLSTLEQLVTMGAGDDRTLLLDQTKELDKAITAQKEDRPLARKQEAQDKKDEQAAAEIAAAAVDIANGENGDVSESTTASDVGRQKHSVLQDHDKELASLDRHLTEVHRSFYEEYEKNRGTRGDRVSQLRDRKPHPRKRVVDEERLNLKAVPDIKLIMPAMKRNALAGVVMVFSGVIPLGADVQSSDIAIWAKSFGAAVAENVSSKVTHVIAARSRTAKVRQAAARYPRIKIVSPQWLYDSISTWHREPEEPYLIAIHPEDRPALNGFEDETTNGPLLSSEDDEGSDGDDLEDEEMTGQNIDVQASETALDMRDVGWTDVDEELKEWLGSDDEDDESDAESVSSASSIQSATTDQPQQQQQLRISAKRARATTPSASSPEEDESRTATSNPTSTLVPIKEKDTSNEKSRLAKRQKIAKERPGSTLKLVERIPSSSSSTSSSTSTSSSSSSTSPPQDRDSAMNGSEDLDVQVQDDEDEREEDEDDDGFAAEFAREFYADQEGEEGEDQGGGGGGGGGKGGT